MRASAQNDGKGHYLVTQICKTTKQYIIYKIPEHKRYLDGSVWYVHSSELPALFKKAKDTKIHDTLDYKDLPPVIVEAIDFAVHNKKPSKFVISPTISNHSVLHLTSDAPTFIVEAVWKAVLKNHHPDHGGDSDAFLKYKEAYEAIKSKRNT